MFISMNWISDFTDLSGVNLKELINKFTLSTAEVEEIYEKGKDIKGVVVAKILSVENHPNSKKLHLLKVDTGKEVVDCVCGAPNVFEGAYVAFATLGGQVGELEIKEAMIAGEKSCGMCCSEKELGLSEDHSGIMILDDSHALGTDIKTFMDIEDTIFEVDNKSLTNRPDLWGHYGIAREIAALNKRPLKPLTVLDTKQYASLPAIDVVVEDKVRAFRYSCIAVDNVTKKVSPLNMKIRLTYCGMRPINLLADLTNYLMLELGQPMHAFDHEKVQKIRVKTYKEPVAFRTLDGVDRMIDTDTLLICDDKEPAAIAGVMGGELSEITDDTTSLLLESANFDGVSVRKAAVRQGMRTEASARYEKTLDPELTIPAIERFLKLLTEIDPGVKVVSSLTDEYVQKYDTITIDFDKAYVDKYTGIDISADQIEETLTALGFGVTRKQNDFSVVVPSYRATKDVTMKADIIEEITRIYGYDNFDIRSTKSLLTPVRHSVARSNEYEIKRILSKRFGMNEVHSYIWYDAKANKEMGIETKENIRVVNAVTTDSMVLRSSMIPTMLNFVDRNVDTYPEMGMFEIGRVIKGIGADGLCNERKTLSVILASKTKTEKEIYFQMKKVLDEVAYLIKGTLPTYQADETLAEANYVHPINSADMMMDGKKVGYFSVLHPKIRVKIDKKLQVAFAEVDLADFEATEYKNVMYTEVSKYPGVSIDLSLLVDKALRYGELETMVKEYTCEYLQKISLVDVFEDAALSIAAKKSVTIRLEFVSMERTLEGQEINTFIEGILAVLKAKGISLR